MTDGLWQSAFVAGLFAIHPLHVESVAWIAERKDVLSAVFFMLTLAAYARYTRAPSPSSILAGSVAFRLWTDVETHARNATGRLVAVGLFGLS